MSPVLPEGRPAAEPELAVVFSPREWADRVVRYVTDHGGGRVRLRVVEGRVALEETFDVLLAEDVTSFLSPRFVRELKERRRTVLGVFDPDEPTGKQRLMDAGVDDVIECAAPSEEFVRRITTLVSLMRTAGDPATAVATHGPVPTGTGAEHVPTDRPEQEEVPNGIVAVGGPPGGCGATELAIELTRTARARGATVVLVDADDGAPSVAQRLGLPLTPNIRTAAEVLFHSDGRLSDVLTPVGQGGFDVVAGLGHPGDWAQIWPAEAVEVVRELAEMADQVVVNVGSRLEDLAQLGGPERFRLSRSMLRAAGTVVAVAAPTPVGITRLLDWLAQMREIAPRRAVHVVVNKAPDGEFARAEIAGEIRRTYVPASLHFLPFDARVEAAAWAGQLVKTGPFTKAVAHAARSLLAVPADARHDRGTERRLWVLRRLRAT
jgi:MinD-like ATPase involved in chromosome partitioning or flagellar assembly